MGDKGGGLTKSRGKKLGGHQLTGKDGAGLNPEYREDPKDGSVTCGGERHCKSSVTLINKSFKETNRIFLPPNGHTSTSKSNVMFADRRNSYILGGGVYTALAGPAPTVLKSAQP